MITDIANMVFKLILAVGGIGMITSMVIAFKK